MTIGNEVFVYNGLPTRVCFRFRNERAGWERRRAVSGSHARSCFSTPEQKNDGAGSLAAKTRNGRCGSFLPGGPRCITPVEVTEKALAGRKPKRKADGTIAPGVAAPRRAWEKSDCPCERICRRSFCPTNLCWIRK